MEMGGDEEEEGGEEIDLFKGWWIRSWLLSSRKEKDETWDKIVREGLFFFFFFFCDLDDWNCQLRLGQNSEQSEWNYSFLVAFRDYNRDFPHNSSLKWDEPISFCIMHVQMVLQLNAEWTRVKSVPIMYEYTVW